jgi:hypothetical protein
MSFLDNFSWAFQNIILKSKSYTEWKYGENIENWEENIDFLGIIQEKGNFWEFAYDSSKNLQFTSKDFELRSPVNISPKKGDVIINNWNNYHVIYPEKVMVDWEIDHNITIIRLIN